MIVLGVCVVAAAIDDDPAVPELPNTLALIIGVDWCDSRHVLYGDAHGEDVVVVGSGESESVTPICFEIMRLNVLLLF